MVIGLELNCRLRMVCASKVESKIEVPLRIVFFSFLKTLSWISQSADPIASCVRRENQRTAVDLLPPFAVKVFIVCKDSA